MSLWKDYHVSEDLIDALKTLAEAPGEACLIAGGSDLLLDIQQGRHPPVHTLVDVSQIPEMTALEVRGEALYVGAAVPLNRVVDSPLAGWHAPALVEAAALIGGPQVRNTATLGGNVAHALPAGDGTIALLALDAQAEVASLESRRRQPIEGLFAGPGRSTLEPHREVLVGFYLPLRRDGEASAFRRVMRPQGVAIAILNFSVWVMRSGEVIQAARIAAGPAGPRPFRARSAESILTGHPPDQATLDAAVGAVLAEAQLRTSRHRATAEYRRKLVEVLLRETLLAAFERALEPATLSVS
jgi:CO/xanthine dehydrogenase FAD-binding subunit